MHTIADSLRPVPDRVPRIAGPFVTLPNLITLTRAPLAIAAMIALGRGAHGLGIGLMLAAFFTDALDGAVARATGSTSEWGRVLDPAADKLVFAVLGVGLCLIGWLPWWFVAVLLVRDATIVAGGIGLALRTGAIPSAQWHGKLSTVFVAVYMLRLVAFPEVRGPAGLGPLGWVALGTAVASAVGYALLAVRVSARADRASPRESPPRAPRSSRRRARRTSTACARSIGRRCLGRD